MSVLRYKNTKIKCNNGKVDNMNITLYSIKNCTKCALLKSELAGTGIMYKEIDVFQNKKGFDELDRLGFFRLPVVKIGYDKYLERPTIDDVKRILEL